MVEHRTVRQATPADDEGIVAVAAAHGFAGADTAVDATYRRFIASQGRLVVALVDDRVVGFGGAVDADGTCMVTDLFLFEANQGQGLGGDMLRALVDGWSDRMTFSSTHERAVPGYQRLGMQPRWTLQYWLGSAPGQPVDGIDVVDVPRNEWQGDRPELADHWSASGGRLLHLHRAGQLVGWSIVVPTGHDEIAWTIARLRTDLPHDVAVRSVLATVPSGERVLVSTPERSAAGAALALLGFELIDHDICCATDGVDVPMDVVALHPGLG